MTSPIQKSLLSRSTTAETTSKTVGKTKCAMKIATASRPPLTQTWLSSTQPPNKTLLTSQNGTNLKITTSLCVDVWLESSWESVTSWSVDSELVKDWPKSRTGLRSTKSNPEKTWSARFKPITNAQLICNWQTVMKKLKTTFKMFNLTSDWMPTI